MTAAYFEDTDRLGLGRPDAEPLATETVDGIVALIAELVEAGHAYESGGDVYFRVRSFAGYGKLSNRRPEDMDQGEEAGSASLKEDRLDFALWKATQGGRGHQLGLALGPGAARLAHRVLGDGRAGAGRLASPIHGGGSDLVFPHHENEIAQSEAAGRPFARVWMHNGMVEAEAEKMSKSEGNIFQLSEALDRYGREAVVAYLISGHYRQPLAFGPEQMEQAVARVERLRNFFREHPVGASPGGSRRSNSGEAPARPPRRLAAEARGVPGGSWLMTSTRRRALAEVFELVGEANRGEVPGAAAAVGGDARAASGSGPLAEPDEGG